MKANLDDITRTVTKINKHKRPKLYDQPMQSLRGGRKFVLRTAYITGAGTKISLFEVTPIYSHANGYVSQWKCIGNRWASPVPESIQDAIKSLERKAGTRLYYVLLISTDGEYL